MERRLPAGLPANRRWSEAAGWDRAHPASTMVETRFRRPSYAFVLQADFADPWGTRPLLPPSRHLVLRVGARSDRSDKRSFRNRRGRARNELGVLGACYSFSKRETAKSQSGTRTSTSSR